MRRLTRGMFDQLADREGFIVVYPNAVRRHWNDGRALNLYFSHRERVDDVGFISLLVDYLVEEFGVDPLRVYVAGMSNGAMMAYRLACELSGKVSAIAAVAGTMPERLARLCRPKRPIPLLMIHGTEDSLIPWEGGEVRIGVLRLGRVLSVRDTVRFWIRHNGCSPQGLRVELPDRDPFDGTRVWREEYPGRAKVVLYGIEGGGHTWPGGRPYIPERVIGRTSRDIEGCSTIWSFFKDVSH